MAVKIKKETYEKLCDLTHAYIDPETGKEMLNPIPKEISPEMDKPLGLKERVQQLIQGELSRQAEQQAFESLQEANDFSLEDEFNVRKSGYEYEDMVPEVIESEGQVQGELELEDPKVENEVPGKENPPIETEGT